MLVILFKKKTSGKLYLTLFAYYNSFAKANMS